MSVSRRWRFCASGKDLDISHSERPPNLREKARSTLPGLDKNERLAWSKYRQWKTRKSGSGPQVDHETRDRKQRVYCQRVQDVTIHELTRRATRQQIRLAAPQVQDVGKPGELTNSRRTYLDTERRGCNHQMITVLFGQPQARRAHERVGISEKPRESLSPHG